MGARSQLDTVRAIRDAAHAGSWSAPETVAEIHRQCRVSLLRAHRLANNWTLADVAARVRAQVSAAGGPAPRVNHPNISRWETGEEKPSARNLDALCRIYHARPDTLGFGADYTDDPHDDVPARPIVLATNPSSRDDERDRMFRRDVLRGLLAATAHAAVSSHQLEAVENTRRAMVEALQRRSVEPSTVGWWEEQVQHHAASYRQLPAPRLLAEVALDFDDLQQLLAQRQSLDAQRRLTTVTAQLAGLVGILCVDVGASRDASRWFHTGQLAAEETEDRALRAWLCTREALALLYYGTAEEAANLARTARRLAADRGLSVAAAMAPAVEARALAQMGRNTEALAAIRHAENVFDKLPGSVTAAKVFGFTESKLRFYQGNVLAHAADIDTASRVHDRAMALYPLHDRVDRGHIQLDQAMSLLRHGELDEACQGVGRALVSLHPDDGTKAVDAQAQKFRATIGSRLSTHKAVRRLDDLLVNLPSERGQLGDPT
ncbi:helix-turn-helix domain-containing protein [Nocardia sp. BMG111209]|uniref:helix-turn-helix domain-containing protein n=1 Tax=Nocardia sp. BMG111209 TaxID=1160137 RepID=UPI000373D865|nr:helix-turn-helix domain-containing protein [Nocardia sp. BMG111209]